MVLRVDHHAIKFNQISVAAVSLAAFIADVPALAGLLALILAVGTARPSWGLFRFLYQRVAVPLRLLQPNVLEDDPAPHRFAQGVGSAFLLAGYAALRSGASAVGWTFVVLVAVLALVNVVFDFCAGCFVYYQLRRAGVIRQPSGGSSGR